MYAAVIVIGSTPPAIANCLPCLSSPATFSCFTFSALAARIRASAASSKAGISGRNMHVATKEGGYGAACKNGDAGRTLCEPPLQDDDWRIREAILVSLGYEYPYFLLAVPRVCRVDRQELRPRIQRRGVVLHANGLPLNPRLDA
eukprot:5198742-Prymnesium_polylepis.1